jgi:hypothetical protein
LRRKTIDLAFPVSRQRVQRAKLVELVRSLPGFESVGKDQVEQAAINLVLSTEVAEGRFHFVGRGPDLHRSVWDHIFVRIETVQNDNTIAALAPAAVATQIELDVTAVLKKLGVRTTGVKFRSLQRVFRGKGYVGD